MYHLAGKIFSVCPLNTPPFVLLQEIVLTYATNDIQYNATYNLDRLDNIRIPLNGIYQRTRNAGKGVTVYVLDSGIRTTHVEFEGRASCGFDAVLGTESLIPCEDLNGHGTHVAGLIGGKTVGVANHVKIVSVKVAPKDFTFEGGAVLYGLQYVLLEKLRNTTKPMVVNMSFGGDQFLLLDFMVEALLAVGVSVVASAGNDGKNACSFSPSGVPGVITVGASDALDIVPWWSNNGPCVDVFAPGVNIVSAGKRNDTRYVIDTGTSQAAPLVTGTVALYLQIQPTLTPAQVFRLITMDSLQNVLKSSPNGTNSTIIQIVKNRLLHTGIFTDTKPARTNPTCPYTGNKRRLCYTEGWWKK
jgi:subtilisin family serine protease